MELRDIVQRARRHIDLDMVQKIDPDLIRLHSLALRVARELEIEPGYFVMHRLMEVLAPMKQHGVQEWPKHVYGKDGADLGLAEDAEQEKELLREAKKAKE